MSQKCQKQPFETGDQRDKRLNNVTSSAPRLRLGKSGRRTRQEAQVRLPINPPRQNWYRET